MNQIAERWKYELILPWFTARATGAGGGDYDQGNYVYIVKSLRADHLWIEAVTYKGGTMVRAGESGSIYAVGQALALPRKVRRLAISVERDRSRFRPTITLEDVLPIIGEVIT